MNINKYLPLFAHGATPVFKETLHGFELIIPLDVPGANNDGIAESPHQVPHQVTHQVPHQVRKLIDVLNGEMGRMELMRALRLKDRVNFKKNYLSPALSLEWIEMTQPKAPKSPTQKYRLTLKGKGFLKTSKGEVGQAGRV